MILAMPFVADHGHMDRGWWFGGTTLWMLLFWGLMVFAVVWLLRAGARRGPGDDVEAAISLLDRRLAQGESTTEGYRERKPALT